MLPTRAYVTRNGPTETTLIGFGPYDADGTRDVTRFIATMRVNPGPPASHLYGSTIGVLGFSADEIRAATQRGAQFATSPECRACGHDPTSGKPAGPMCPKNDTVIIYGRLSGAMRELLRCQRGGKSDDELRMMAARVFLERQSGKRITCEYPPPAPPPPPKRQKMKEQIDVL